MWSRLLMLVLIGVIGVVGHSAAGTVTVCQCNIYDGGKWTEQDKSTVTYDTAKRFAQWVASVNPQGSTFPPIAVIGMQELMTETDRATIQSFLQQYTGAPWESARTPQGVNGTSGIGMFWRTDLLEYRPEWYLGEKVIETIDNGYVAKFVGRLFKKRDSDEAFGFFTGKLIWDDAVLNGHTITEEERRQEAIRLKTWIREGEPGSPGMSCFPGTTRVIACDLNSDTGTLTWQEMDQEFSDPANEHTHNSFWGTLAMDLFGKRLDYIWWDYDAFAKRPGGFVYGPQRSPHFGSDHRAVYATIEVHPVDLTPPTVTITQPENGASVNGTVKVSASASDTSGIMQVEFMVDGVSVWTDTTPPYEFDWDTSGLSQDYHILTAVATDASSNRIKGQSAPVVVWVGPAESEPSITNARSKPNGSLVSVRRKVVTASFGSYFYIEEPNRTAGIKVTNATAAPAVGTVVNVAGTLNTLNGEREISATSVTEVGSAEVPEPVGLTNKNLGGGPAGPYTPGVYGSLGPNNVGLLVRCWGKVRAVVGTYYMYIDDGSRLRDGYGYEGIRIDISGLTGWTPPSIGKYVGVTGISTTSMISGKIQRRLKVRQAADVQVLN
ncbi:MAG: Ig-like domain-containing protein [Armatimonadota bacterium]|nr:Ig-like domain-containing protein [Armatimonadota bacterium]